MVSSVGLKQLAALWEAVQCRSLLAVMICMPRVPVAQLTRVTWC